MELFNLKGKTAMITGASSGLGTQFARCLSSAGARVILVARRIHKLNSLANELGNALPLEIDVADKESVKNAFQYFENSSEKIDICINNSGIFKLTKVFEEDKQNDFESIIQTNVMGMWYVTKAASHHMRKHGIQGSIINIGSVNGANCLGPEFSSYCASKAAIMQITKALVGELSIHKIRINCINPGLYSTPMTEDQTGNETSRKEAAKTIPLGFVAETNEMDGTILYLASNKASRYLTGSVITIDGGISWGG